jgi:hypothetical protein
MWATGTSPLAAATLLSHYTCSGLDSNYFPQGGCKYYGKILNIDSNTPLLATSSCSSPSQGSSSSSSLSFSSSSSSLSSSSPNCTIITCMQYDTTFQKPSCATDNTAITVKIEQSCTPVANNTPLSCTYGSGLPHSSKTENLYINCDATAGVSCHANDLTSVQIKKQCANSLDHDTGMYSCQIYDDSVSSSSSPTPIWLESCQRYTSNVYPYCLIRSGGSTNTNTPLGAVTCKQPINGKVSCTITDDNSNTMTITCSSSQDNNPLDWLCTSTPPECPATQVPPGVPSGKIGAATPITESNIVCSGSLVADMFIGDQSQSTGYIRITYPLSKAELLFVLGKIGAGKQEWTSNPVVKYL